MSLRPGHFKTYSTPEDSFWCCVGSGMENHTKYNDSIYFRGADSLYVNLFIPSRLAWEEKGLVLVQQTAYPRDGRVVLRFATKKPVTLGLKVRTPRWAPGGLRFLLNGERLSAEAAADGYTEIRRTWRAGDRLQVTIPMAVRAEATPDDPLKVAFLYGPLVLAADLGPAPRGRTFPYDRYNVYWDVLTPAQYAERRMAIRVEAARRAELDARTIDEYRPGEQQSEVDHNQRGERTSAHEWQYRKLRHAEDGGWFSFNMKVVPDRAVELACTYWGGELGNRTFDILIDGKLLATESLHQDKPGAFFQKTYAIPEELTRGRPRVEVRFRAHLGNFAGGLFGARTLKARP
jgi:hypothetical protein